MAKFQYWYKAKVTDVYDGDTITVDIDLGFGITMHKQKIRLYGINAPEVRGEERDAGLITREHLRAAILGREIVLNSYKDKTGKFGRFLAFIYCDSININDQMVRLGLAEYRVY